MLAVFAADYPDGSNSSEYLVQPTTYLPENFTYAQNLPCPERLPSMSKSAGTRRQESTQQGGTCTNITPLLTHSRGPCGREHDGDPVGGGRTEVLQVLWHRVRRSLETTGLPTSLEGGSLHHNTRAPTGDNAYTTDVDWLLLSTEATSRQKLMPKLVADKFSSQLLLLGYIITCFYYTVELNLTSFLRSWPQK